LKGNYLKLVIGLKSITLVNLLMELFLIRVLPIKDLLNSKWVKEKLFNAGKELLKI
jgi:hypothetical protein